ncbi:MAG: hypothetical protein R2712_19530 [Vicinamibacterales bacterium]
MKTILKIALVLVIVTATVQAGRAAIKHYTFVDALQESLLFASSRTEDELYDTVLNMAAERAIPIDPDRLSVRREPFLIEIDAPYTDTVNLLPGVLTRQWEFHTSVAVRLLNDTRPRGTTTRRRTR